MPNVSLPQTIFLIMIIAAFVLFGVTLLGVSLYAMSDSKKQASNEPVERKVIPARRATSAH
jgi:flagellar basal body-associated protein FliL